MEPRKVQIIFEPLVPKRRVLTSEVSRFFESIGLSKVNDLLQDERFQLPRNELEVREFLDNFDLKKNESFVQGQRITISPQLFESLLGTTSGSDRQRGPRYLPREREVNWPPEWPSHFLDKEARSECGYGWSVKRLKPKYRQIYEWFGRVILLKNTKSWTYLSNGAAKVLVRGENGKRDVDWGRFWFRNFLFEMDRIQNTKSKIITTVIGQIICMILDETRQNEDDEVPCQPKRSPKLDTPTSITAGVSVRCHQEPRTFSEAPGDELSMDQKSKNGVEEYKDAEITATIDVNKIIGTEPSGEQLQHIGAANIDYERLDEQQQEENVIEATNVRFHPASLGFVGGHEELSRIHISGLPDVINSKDIFLRSQSSLEHVKEGWDKKRKRDADMSQLSVGNLIVHQGSTTQEADELEEGQMILQQETSNTDHPRILGLREVDPSQDFSKPVFSDAGLSSEGSPLIVSNGSGGASIRIIALDGDHEASATRTHDTSPLILPSAIDHGTAEEGLKFDGTNVDNGAFPDFCDELAKRALQEGLKFDGTNVDNGAFSDFCDELAKRGQAWLAKSLQADVTVQQELDVYASAHPYSMRVTKFDECAKTGRELDDLAKTIEDSRMEKVWEELRELHEGLMTMLEIDFPFGIDHSESALVLASISRLSNEILDDTDDIDDIIEVLKVIPKLEEFTRNPLGILEKLHVVHKKLEQLLQKKLQKKLRLRQLLKTRCRELSNNIRLWDEVWDISHPTTIHNREGSYTETEDEEVMWNIDLRLWRNFWTWMSLIFEILAGKKSATIHVIFSQQGKNHLIDPGNIYSRMAFPNQRLFLTKIGSKS